MKNVHLTSAWGSIFLMVALPLIVPGCQSHGTTEPVVDPVAKISMHDRLRLTLADADSVGIHMFDLKQMRSELMTLKETEPVLAETLLSDLNRVEALPKTDVRARVAIGKEMYARIKEDR